MYLPPHTHTKKKISLQQTAKEWRGSRDEAERHWGRERFGVSKLAVIVAEGKDPRLVVDATSSNINPCARFPERSEYPTIAQIMEMVERHHLDSSDPLAALTLDVKQLQFIAGLFILGPRLVIKGERSKKKKKQGVLTSV